MYGVLNRFDRLAVSDHREPRAVEQSLVAAFQIKQGVVKLQRVFIMRQYFVLFFDLSTAILRQKISPFLKLFQHMLAALVVQCAELHQCLDLCFRYHRSFTGFS